MNTTRICRLYLEPPISIRHTGSRVLLALSLWAGMSGCKQHVVAQLQVALAPPLGGTGPVSEPPVQVLYDVHADLVLPFHSDWILDSGLGWGLSQRGRMWDGNNPSTEFGLHGHYLSHRFADRFRWLPRVGVHGGFSSSGDSVLLFSVEAESDLLLYLSTQPYYPLFLSIGVRAESLHVTGRGGHTPLIGGAIGFGYAIRAPRQEAD